MNLRDVLRQEISAVLEAGRSELRQAAHDSVSCEKWLQGALYERLKGMTAVEVHLNEDQVDLALRSNASDEKILVEIKAFPTNYGQAGKPITQFIDSVIAALAKLRARVGERVLGQVIWVAYPVPTDIPDQWIDHLARVKRAGSATEKVVAIAVGTDMKALAYTSRP